MLRRKSRWISPRNGEFPSPDRQRERKGGGGGFARISVQVKAARAKSDSPHYGGGRLEITDKCFGKMVDRRIARITQSCGL